MSENGHEFLRVGTLAELQVKGRMVLRGHRHRPVLVVCDQGRIRAFDNRCPHMGFPLDRGSVAARASRISRAATNRVAPTAVIAAPPQ